MMRVPLLPVLTNTGSADQQHKGCQQSNPELRGEMIRRNGPWETNGPKSGRINSSMNPFFLDLCKTIKILYPWKTQGCKSSDT